MSTAHVAVASLNQTVGDWSGNRRRIEAVCAEARRRGARLVVMPEMCVSGYSLGDRVLRADALERSARTLLDLLPATEGMVAILGLPLLHRDVLYDAVAVLADGRLAGIVPKENLATGDVLYENRWFAGWPRSRVETWRAPDGNEVPIGGLLFQAAGLGRFAIEICEDAWKGIRPGSIHALAGALIVANPSASWFAMGKHHVRRQMVEQISREDHGAYLYGSLLGCDATRLIFDGSVFIAEDGVVTGEGRRFVFTRDFELIDRVVDLEALTRARMEEGSWRQQVESLVRGDFGPAPPLVEVAGDFSGSAPPPAPAPHFRPAPPPSADPSLDWLAANELVPPIAAADVPYLELELALCMGLRDYLRKSGIRGLALALSGGRDSSMCAMLVARMVRYDRPDLAPRELRAEVARRLVTAYMATANSGEATRRAAQELADELGARHLEAQIQAAVDTHIDLCAQLTGTALSWSDPAHDIPLQNVQARLRGSLIWMVADLEGFLLISTSNQSEAAVGYATMDGDTSGGLAPLAGVPKSLISLWLDWAARFHGLKSLHHVLKTPATAELRPPDRAQKDEDDLMPFEVLDRLMFHFVQLGQSPLVLFQTLWPELSARYAGDPRAFAAHIRRFVRMLCAAQWKRERFAISFRVTAFDLDPKTGFRFPPVQAPFTEELAELDAHVDALAQRPPRRVRKRA